MARLADAFPPLLSGLVVEVYRATCGPLWTRETFGNWDSGRAAPWTTLKFFLTSWGSGVVARGPWPFDFGFWISWSRP